VKLIIIVYVGVIPASGHVTITILYSPLEYCTACAKLQVTN